MRISAKLVELENGYPIWTERYDRLLNDIFEIQDEISRAIASKLQLTLGSTDPTPQVSTPLRNLRAYEMYLKGRYFWNKRTEEDLRRGAEYFERGLTEDSNEALAHAGLADVYVTLALYGGVRPVEFMPLARNAADRALELKPHLPEALTSRACLRAVFNWDWSSAAKEFEAAIHANPSYAPARQWYAMNCLSPQGAFARAREELRKAAELDPVSLAVAASVGILAFFEHQYDRAAMLFRAVLEMDHGFYLAHYFLGLTCAEQGLHSEAIREAERSVAISGGSSESISALGYVQARAGNPDAARTQLDELAQRSARRYVSPVLLAQVHAALGDYDRAFSNLEDAFHARATDLVWLNVRPAFDSIRSDARTIELLRRLGLRASPDDSTRRT